MSCVMPRGAFYAMPSVTLPPGRTDEDYVLGLLRATGVLCVYGSGFGTNPADGFFRVVFLAPLDELATIYDDIASFTASYLERLTRLIPRSAADPEEPGFCRLCNVGLVGDLCSADCRDGEISRGRYYPQHENHVCVPQDGCARDTLLDILHGQDRRVRHHPHGHLPTCAAGRRMLGDSPDCAFGNGVIILFSRRPGARRWLTYVGHHARTGVEGNPLLCG